MREACAITLGIVAIPFMGIAWLLGAFAAYVVGAFIGGWEEVAGHSHDRPPVIIQQQHNDPWSR